MDKVLIVANNVGGLVKFRGMLIQELRKKFQVCCVIPEESGIEELKRLSSNVITIPIDRRGINPIRDLALIVSYYKVLKKEKPKMVITYTIKPNIYMGTLCRLLGIEYDINCIGIGNT